MVYDFDRAYCPIFGKNKGILSDACSGFNQCNRFIPNKDFLTALITLNIFKLNNLERGETKWDNVILTVIRSQENQELNSWIKTWLRTENVYFMVKSDKRLLTPEEFQDYFTSTEEMIRRIAGLSETIRYGSSMNDLIFTCNP
jgi:hypothetical protein